jgi:hypothetical protein
VKKGLLLVVAVLAGALLYVTTAPATEYAVTPAQFKALQKRVKNLEGLVATCFQGGMPVTSYGGYVVQNTDGTEIITSALDVTDQGDTPLAFALDVGADCAAALNQNFKVHFRTIKARPVQR